MALGATQPLVPLLVLQLGGTLADVGLTASVLAAMSPPHVLSQIPHIFHGRVMRKPLTDRNLYGTKPEMGGKL